jgi:hypothetical protein
MERWERGARSATLTINGVTALGAAALQQTSLTLDFNYTLSKSFDDASGLMTSGVSSGSAFIVNPFRQRDNYAVSDFDVDARHQRQRGLAASRSGKRSLVGRQGE